MEQQQGVLKVNTIQNSIDKTLFFKTKILIFSYFVLSKIYVVVSLEAPRRGVSNEYSQHMFSCRNTVDSRYLDLAYLE